MTDAQLPSPPSDYDTGQFRSGKTRRGLYVRASLVIILLAAMAYSGWQFYQQQQQLQTLLMQLQTQQQLLQAQAAQQTQTTTQQLAQMQQAHDDVAGQLATLLERDLRTREDWLVIEAEHLVKLANQQLVFERDVTTAIKALQAADARLRQSQHPAIITLRKAIAEDLNALRNLPVVDTVGISLALSTLTQQVERLPLQIADPVSHAQAPPTTPERKPIENWTELPGAIWQDLKSLVVIRDHAEPVAAMLPPEQRFFLNENLRLQLEQARLAMLTGEDKIFKERIDTALKWTQRYFDSKAKPVQTAVDTLKRLQRENIAPAIPELSRSYQAITQYLQQADRSARRVKPAKNGDTAP